MGVPRVPDGRYMAPCHGCGRLREEKVHLAASREYYWSLPSWERRAQIINLPNSFSNPMLLSTVPIHPNLSQTTLVDGSVQLVSITMKP